MLKHIKLKYCLPRVRGKGSGLGNELIAWSRAYLMGQVLGINTLAPAFGRNQRQYWRHFGTPRYDWLIQRALCASLPLIEFSERDYFDFGGGNVLQSFREFAIAKRLLNRNAFIITTEGMWGGYYHIKEARDFIYSTLFNSQFAANNLAIIKQRLSPNKLTVGMHVRLGDFAEALANADYRGKFNVSLPLDWYINIGKELQDYYGDAVQFLIASDGTKDQLKPITDSFNCVLTNDLKNSDCSDILALANVDLLVCSVSSFSAIAAFLSDAPYLWYEPQLQIHQEGFYSIWGHEPDQKKYGSSTLRAIQSWQSDKSMTPKGWPVNGTGKIKKNIFDSIEEYRLKKNVNLQADLLMYGVVPTKLT